MLWPWGLLILGTYSDNFAASATGGGNRPRAGRGAAGSATARPILVHGTSMPYQLPDLGWPVPGHGDSAAMIPVVVVRV